MAQVEQLIQQCTETLHELTLPSVIRNILTPERMKDIAGRLHLQEEANGQAAVDFLVSMLSLWDVGTAQEFDSALKAVMGSTHAHAGSAPSFLSLESDGQPGTWYGGMFETFAKSRLIERGLNPTFDVPLPNGRDRDAVVVIDGQPLNFECTVLTDDDENKRCWRSIFEAKRIDPDLILVRPGDMCPKDAKGPSPTMMLVGCTRSFLTK